MKTFLIFLLLTSPVMAQSLAVTNACSADAIRLCNLKDVLRASHGDHAGVALCFRQHRRELSAGCRAALIAERHVKRVKKP